MLIPDMNGSTLARAGAERLAYGRTPASSVVSSETSVKSGYALGGGVRRASIGAS